MLAGQQIGTNTQNDQMKTKAALVQIAAHDPLENAIQADSGQGKGRRFVTDRLEIRHRIVEAYIGWKIAG
jgi:hypothetical protein